MTEHTTSDNSELDNFSPGDTGPGGAGPESGPPESGPPESGPPGDARAGLPGGEAPAPGGGTAAAERGVGRLKYAGVGPPRAPEPRAKLSGADVTALGSLEAEILGLLWRIGRPATGMEVMEASLYARRAQGQEPASFATIATTLRRLAEKGVLLSEKAGRGEKGASRTPVYTPLVGREEMAARILDNVSRTLLGQPLHGLLPRLLGGLRGDRQGRKTTEDARESEEVRRLLRALEEAAGERQDNEGPA